MPQPIVFLSPTLNAVRQAAAQRFSSRENTLVLSNTSGIARGWREVLRDESNPPDCVLPRFASLNDWLLEAATLDAAPVWSTPADRRFLLRALMPGLRSRLRDLHRLCRSNDLVRQLDLLIADLRRSGHDTFHFGGDWGHDLQLIIAEYNRRLRENDAVDIECAPQIWAQNQSASNAESIACVVFDQLLAPSFTQWNAMLALRSQAGSTLVALVVPWLESETQSWDDALAQTQNTALERILYLWKEAGAELEIVAPQTEKTEKQNAVRALLSYRQTSAPPHCDCTAAFAPRDEMERVAIHVRAHCNVPAALENAALVLPDAATYAGILQPVFSAHGVPIRVRRARPHSTYPLVARLSKMLQLHDGDWSVDEIADLFGDNLLRLCCDENSAENNSEDSNTLDIQRLRTACFEAGIDSLRDEKECFQRLLQHASFKKGVLQNSEEAPQLDPDVARDLACVSRLRESIARVVSAANAENWQHEVFILLQQTVGHLPRQAGSTPGLTEAAAQLEVFAEAVSNVATRFARWQPKLLQSKKSDNHNFANLAFDCLRLELENARAPLEENLGAALEVLSPLQLLSDVPREIYFAGLIESAWPAFGAPGTLLSRHRNELSVLRAHEIEPTQMARYQLALAVVEADAVHLLHPTRSGGREVLRSPILEDVALCWENLPTLEKPTLPTSRAALLQLLSRWTQAGDLQNMASQLSPSLSQSLEIVGVDAAVLNTLQRIEGERSSAQTLGIYDGALGEKGARLLREIEILRGRENEPPQLSASRLNTYAQCPLKFFYRHILKLAEPCAWQDDLGGLQSGTMIHKILEKFWKRCALPLTEENQGELWFLLRTIALEQIAEEPLRPLLREVEARRLLASQAREPGGMLGKMLMAEIAQNTGGEKKPAFAAPVLPLAQTQISLPDEFSIGVEKTLHMPLGGFQIEGRLDRLAVSRDGETLAIIDYKTQSSSSLPSFLHADWGFDFQLPIYLLIARAHLRKWRGAQAGSTPSLSLVAAFFALRDSEWVNGFGRSGTLGRNQNKTGLSTKINFNGEELSAEFFDRWLDQFEKRVVGIGALAQRGQFNISIQERGISNCNYCEFQTICRRNDAVSDARLEAAYNRATHFGEEIYLPEPIGAVAEETP